MPDAPRPTSELAADVEADIATLRRFIELAHYVRPASELAGPALDALVARIADLEAQVETALEAMQAAWNDTNKAIAQRQAAEAQVAALAAELDIGAEAAEAALATTRQALTDIAQHDVDEAGPAARIARRALAETDPK